MTDRLRPLWAGELAKVSRDHFVGLLKRSIRKKRVDWTEDEDFLRWFEGQTDWEPKLGNPEPELHGDEVLEFLHIAFRAGRALGRLDALKSDG